jgi:hypothetical protein
MHQKREREGGYKEGICCCCCSRVYITRESIKESTVRVSAGLHNTYVCATRQAKNVENITRQWPNDLFLHNQRHHRTTTTRPFSSFIVYKKKTRVVRGDISVVYSSIDRKWCPTKLFVVDVVQLSLEMTTRERERERKQRRHARRKP